MGGSSCIVRFMELGSFMRSDSRSVSEIGFPKAQAICPAARADKLTLSHFQVIFCCAGVTKFCFTLPN